MWQYVSDPNCSTMEHIFLNGKPIGTIERKIHGFSASCFIVKKTVRRMDKQQAEDFILNTYFNTLKQPIQTKLNL